MPTYIRKPDYVKAKRLSESEWVIAHPDGWNEVMSDAVFREVFDPASINALTELDGWTFDIFIGMGRESMMTIIRSVYTDVLAFALKSIRDERILNPFFDNMSPMSVKLIKEWMEDLAQSRIDNTPKARREILEIVRQLAEEGKINLVKGLALDTDSSEDAVPWNEDVAKCDQTEGKSMIEILEEGFPSDEELDEPLDGVSMPPSRSTRETIEPMGNDGCVIIVSVEKWARHEASMSNAERLSATEIVLKP